MMGNLTSPRFADMCKPSVSTFEILLKLCNYIEFSCHERTSFDESLQVEIQCSAL